MNLFEVEISGKLKTLEHDEFVKFIENISAKSKPDKEPIIKYLLDYTSYLSTKSAFTDIESSTFNRLIDLVLQNQYPRFDLQELNTKIQSYMNNDAFIQYIKPILKNKLTLNLSISGNQKKFTHGEVIDHVNQLEASAPQSLDLNHLEELLLGYTQYLVDEPVNLVKDFNLFKTLFSMVSQSKGLSETINLLNPIIQQQLNNKWFIQFIRPIVNERFFVAALNEVSPQDPTNADKPILILAHCQTGTRGDAVFAINLAKALTKNNHSNIIVKLKMGDYLPVPEDLLHQASNSRIRVIDDQDLRDSFKKQGVWRNEESNAYKLVIHAALIGTFDGIVSKGVPHLYMPEYNTCRQPDKTIPSVLSGIGQSQHGIFKQVIDQNLDSADSDKSKFENKSIRQYANDHQVFFSYQHAHGHLEARTPYLLFATHMAVISKDPRPTTIFCNAENINQYLSALEATAKELYPNKTFMVHFNHQDYLVPPAENVQDIIHINIQNPFPLQRQTMLSLMQTCKAQNHPIMITGDQSLSEAISMSIPCFYEAVLSDKDTLSSNLANLAKNAGLNYLPLLLGRKHLCEIRSCRGESEKWRPLYSTKEMHDFAIWYQQHHEIVTGQMEGLSQLIPDLNSVSDVVAEYFMNPSPASLARCLSNIHIDATPDLSKVPINQPNFKSENNTTSLHSKEGPPPFSTQNPEKFIKAAQILEEKSLINAFYVRDKLLFEQADKIYKSSFLSFFSNSASYDTNKGQDIKTILEHAINNKINSKYKKSTFETCVSLGWLKENEDKTISLGDNGKSTPLIAREFNTIMQANEEGSSTLRPLR